MEATGSMVGGGPGLEDQGRIAGAEIGRSIPRGPRTGGSMMWG